MHRLSHCSCWNQPRSLDQGVVLSRALHCARAPPPFSGQLPQCIFWGVAVIPSPMPSVSHIMPACILYSSIYPHLPLWQCCDLGRKPRWSLFLLDLLWSSLRRAHPRCPPMMNALTAREFWRWSCTAALRFNDTLISRTALKRCCLHLFIFVSRHGLLQLSVLA